MLGTTDDYGGLVMYNAWKIPEERNNNGRFLTKKRINVDHALSGETPSG